MSRLIIFILCNINNLCFNLKKNILTPLCVYVLLISAFKHQYLTFINLQSISSSLSYISIFKCALILNFLISVGAHYHIMTLGDKNLILFVSSPVTNAFIPC